MKLAKQYRTMELKATRVTRAATDGQAADTTPVYRVVLATETPYERYYGIEVLSLDPKAVDLSFAKRGGMPFFLEHGGYPYKLDPRLHVGVLENPRIEERELVLDARFSRSQRGQEARQNVDDQITLYVSAGYIPITMKQTKKADLNKPDDKNEYLVTRWKPVEGSIVLFPADPNATVEQRSQETEQFEVEVEGELSPVEDTMKYRHQNPPPAATAAAPAAPAPSAIVEVRTEGPGTAAAGAAAATASASSRAVEIVRLCEQHGLQTRTAEFIESGKSLAEIGLDILNAKASAVRPQPAAEALRNVPAKDRKRYSCARAVRQAVMVAAGNGRYDGVEAELHEELSKQLPASYQSRGGFLMPIDTRTPEEIAERQVRTMGTGSAGGGTELVFDRPGEIIEILRNRAMVAQAGAQILTGLTGPVPFPKQTGDPTIRWMGENPASAAASSELAFGTVLLSPKTMIGTVPFPRQLVNMASLDIEGRIRNNLGAQHGLEADRVSLHGKGTDGEPLGIFDTPGVAAVAMGGVPDYTKIVSLGSAISDANADVGTLRYMTTPLMAGKLKTALVASAAGSDFIWSGTFRDGQMAGYQAHATKQVRKNLGAGSDEHGLFFGDWSQVQWGFWGALEFIVDIVTQAAKGQIIITTFQMFDEALLRPEAFAIGTGAKIA
jgi:HK97 family phage major capsid protein